MKIFGWVKLLRRLLIFKKVNYINIIGLNNFLIIFVLNFWMVKSNSKINKVVKIILFWFWKICCKLGIIFNFLMVEVMVIVGVKVLFDNKVVFLIIVGIIN